MRQNFQKNLNNVVKKVSLPKKLGKLITYAHSSDSLKGIKVFKENE